MGASAVATSVSQSQSTPCRSGDACQMVQRQVIDAPPKPTPATERSGKALKPSLGLHSLACCGSEIPATDFTSHHYSLYSLTVFAVTASTPYTPASPVRSVVAAMPSSISRM